MKSIGIVRKVDDLGRIVIPKEMRKNLDMDVGACVEMYVEKDTVVFKKLKLKQCEKCGIRVDETDLYCSKCGNEV